MKKTTAFVMMFIIGASLLARDAVTPHPQPKEIPEAATVRHGEGNISGENATGQDETGATTGKSTTGQDTDKRRISGLVLDEKGEAIIGANLIEKGTTNGTVTDIDGHFALNVGENAVLQVSYMGYLPQRGLYRR